MDTVVRPGAGLKLQIHRPVRIQTGEVGAGNPIYRAERSTKYYLVAVIDSNSMNIHIRPIARIKIGIQGAIWIQACNIVARSGSHIVKVPGEDKLAIGSQGD